MTAPTPELTQQDLVFLARVVADRVNKEKAKQRWGRVPKKVRRCAAEARPYAETVGGRLQ